MDEVDNKEKQGNKRSHDEMKAGPSFSITEKIEDFIHSLKEKHGETHQPYQSRLWVEMLALGSDKNEDEPPNLPIFRNKAMKKSSPGAGQVSTSKVLATQDRTFSDSLKSLTT
ncbi:uncharacterized protein LOC114950660 isoform X1 [Acropora millepora]|uniref:uncharacterized protein LOC114950660 isoform X1 n=1 Tax=Acropora millepora TaxID=45264 RepID=UPI001CF2EBBE|nr:uncharacterized protein LOC114950660 isoform X1 [Acropora millepora]